MDDSKYQIDLLTALNQKLMNSEKMYRHICECTGNLCMFFDYNVSPVKVDLIGPWDEVLGMRLINHPYDEAYMLNFIYEEDQDLFRNKILEIERENITNSGIEIRSRNKTRWFSVNATVSYDDYSNPLEKVVIFRDITIEKKVTDELKFHAHYDALTGLYSRNHFINVLDELLARANEEEVSVEVLFVDIDNFKKINDSIGFLYGDELVKQFAEFLIDFASPEINIGRFGSDVFIISVYNPCGLRSANVIYKSIIERLRRTFTLSNGQEINLEVTCGVVEFPEAGRNSSEVIKTAEIILDKAKENTKNSILYYETSIIDGYNRILSLESKLKDSIENMDFELFYQPIFYTETGQLRGAEVLIRWPNGRGGFVAEPDTFIPLTEKNGSIITVGNWIIKEAVRTLNDWRIKYRVPINLCINISAVQLAADDFIENLQSVLDLYNINPEQIELEINETALVQDFDELIDKLKTIRGIGMKVSLDDFGTGYSSITYLNKLPIDTLKLDRNFLNMAMSDDATCAIVTSIIGMSKKLGVLVVAEGVETKEQFKFLRKNKCDLIQGFLLGRPVSKNEFEKVIIRQMP